MTVAVLVKVFDGVVLGADSAMSVSLSSGSTHVFGHGNKVFQLHREQPIGAMAWGLGNIDSVTVSRISKELRGRLMGADRRRLGWTLPDNYCLEWVANRARELIFDEIYAPTFRGREFPGEPLGFLVAGYSAGASTAETWQFLVTDPNVRPELTCTADQSACGWKTFAQPEATERLFHGYGGDLFANIVDAIENPDDQARVVELLRSGIFTRQAMVSATPIGDAIEFAKYLANVTVGYSRFVLGPNTVDGPVDIAAITRYEGFKWVERKHYYPQSLNIGAGS